MIDHQPRSLPPNKPPEAVPPPEPSKNNFSVEVQQPDLLFKLAVTAARTREESTLINQVDVREDPLFASDPGDLEAQRSFLRHYKDSETPANYLYYFETILRLSKQRLTINGGYISRDEIEKISAALQAKGYQTELRKAPEEENILVFSKGNTSISMLLGHESREVHGAYIRRRAEEEAKKSEIGRFRKYVLPNFERGYERNYGVFLIGKPKNLETAELSQMAFIHEAHAYAAAYKDAVDVLYEVEGYPVPNQKVILRPPILNQDTLAQIKSSESTLPLKLVESQVEKEMPNFKDIAGQAEAVMEAERLVLAINHPEVFERRGVKRPKGILFYGPPGTGKTLLAKAIATESQAVFLSVSAADVGTKWYGESEKLMQQVFDLANDAVAKGQKVILFFDEVDALAPPRETAHEATKKVVATLLQNMDGMKANPDVTIIFATNRPEDIDEALKRPGRIDKLIWVGLPDEKGRQETFRVHMDKAKKAATASGELFSAEIDFVQLGQATDGMSQADIANLVNLTLEEKTIAELEGEQWSPITTTDILATAKRFGVLKEQKRQLGFLVPEKLQPQVA